MKALQKVSESILYYLTEKWPNNIATKNKPDFKKYNKEERNYKYALDIQFKSKLKTGVPYEFIDKKILEIGLGTDNENLLSNMGKQGKPGASLKAFRDYFKNSKIYGADIDKNILFSDLKIKTSFVDQTNQKSMDLLFKKFGGNFDLIIDDLNYCT